MFVVYRMEFDRLPIVTKIVTKTVHKILLGGGGKQVLLIVTNYAMVHYGPGHAGSLVNIIIKTTVFVILFQIKLAQLKNSEEI